MKIVNCFSHLGGHEIMLAHRPQELAEITLAVRAVNEECKIKLCAEKGRRAFGRNTWSPKAINSAIASAMTWAGWQPRVAKDGKQTDFHKNRVDVEVQFGKYSFFAYDLTKHRTNFAGGKLVAAVEIVPAASLAVQINSGPPNFPGCVRHLTDVTNSWAVPVLLLGITDDAADDPAVDILKLQAA